MGAEVGACGWLSPICETMAALWDGRTAEAEPAERVADRVTEGPAERTAEPADRVTER